MDAEFVSIGVYNYGRSATGRHDRRLKGKLHFVIPEVLDRLIEVIYLQHKMRTIAGWLQERFISDPERVRPNLILDPELVAVNKGSHAGETQHTLIEGSGTRQIRGWIDDESKFDNFHWLDAFGTH